MAALTGVRLSCAASTRQTPLSDYSVLSRTPARQPRPTRDSRLPGGRQVVVMDADLQNDPQDIPRMLGHLCQWDTVTGRRVNRDHGDNLARWVSSRLGNWVRNRLSGDSLHDSGCTFRAFRPECLHRLQLYRGFHRFIPTLLRMHGYRVLEIPVSHRPRRFGRSKCGVSIGSSLPSPIYLSFVG